MRIGQEKLNVRMCDLISGETAMSKLVFVVGLASAALLGSAAIADDLTFYSPYEIITDYPGCKGPGMVALHVKFDAQAEADYFLGGQLLGMDQEESCKLTTRKGTSKVTFEIPCAESVAPAAPTEEEQDSLKRMFALPETVSVRGEIFHCLSSNARDDGNRDKQETLAGSWSAELPAPNDFSIGDGEFGQWENRARFYPSRTEILFDGGTEVALPPYLRLFIGPAQMFDEKTRSVMLGPECRSTSILCHFSTSAATWEARNVEVSSVDPDW